MMRPIQIVKTLVVAAGLWLGPAGASGADVTGPVVYRVDYRAGDLVPWQWYTSTRGLEKAEQTAAALRQTGFDAQVVPEAARTASAIPVPVVVGSPGYVFYYYNQGAYPGFWWTRWYYARHAAFHYYYSHWAGWYYANRGAWNAHGSAWHAGHWAWSHGHHGVTAHHAAYHAGHHVANRTDALNRHAAHNGGHHGHTHAQAGKHAHGNAHHAGSGGHGGHTGAHRGGHHGGGHHGRHG